MADTRAGHVVCAERERSESGEAAPIEETITINSSIKEVWEMFINLSCWHRWNTVMTVVSPAGRIAEGKRFTFLMNPFVTLRLSPVAEEVLYCARLTLSGHKFGLRARHEFFFEEREGKTVVTSRESFTGIMPSLPGWFLLRRRIKMLTGHMLRDLKIAAESEP